MNLLIKLQRRTLVPAQIAGYALALFAGIAIAALTLQLCVDTGPLLTRQTDVFKAHTVTVSKNVTLFKTANRNSIYFSDKELQRLKSQEFVKNVAQFTSSSFAISAAISFDGQRMGTDLFFESVPDRYIDVQSDDWLWDSTSGFLPIIIPEDYLNLYNFGFAESQSLPVVSPALLSQVTFSIIVEGNGRRKVYDSRIVGLSAKINSILVPEDFLQWANREFGTAAVEGHSSRLLVEFNDASDERIPQYFETNGLNINKAELESGKMAFFFRLAALALLAIAAIIIVLSVAFIVLSMNLIVQRNRDMVRNLRHIGYTTGEIGRFYQRTVGVVTLGSALLALVAVMVLRRLYVVRLSALFDVGGGTAVTLIGIPLLAASVLAISSVLLRKNINRL